MDQEWIEEDIEYCVLHELDEYCGNAFCYLLSETQEELDAIWAEIEAYYKQKAEEDDEDDEEEEEEDLPPMQKRISTADWIAQEFAERANEGCYEYEEFFYEPFDHYPHVNAFLQKMFPQIEKLLTAGVTLDMDCFNENAEDLIPCEQWAKDGIVIFSAAEKRMLKRLNG